MQIIDKIRTGIKRRWVHPEINRRISAISEAVNRIAPEADQAPVIFFNSSTRLEAVSLNASFSLITAWALKLQGVPVYEFVCNGGLKPCVLGTNQSNPHTPPPCVKCTKQSTALVKGFDAHWFSYQHSSRLEDTLEDLSVSDMQQFVWEDIPLGELVIPSLRWILRIHHLQDDEQTRYLLRQYILSAYQLGMQFRTFFEQVQPQAIVLYNGLFYPEAIVKWMARNLVPNIPVFTHEVGLYPFTGFFTNGDAPSYPMIIPDDFQLSNEQNTRLDQYLSDRSKGQFKMAGIQFWKGMQGLDESLQEKISLFRQFVPIFTNVVFDTSQGQANVLFPHMFAWLDQIKEIIQENPDTFFLIRAHPDEKRALKTSRETVETWYQNSGLDELENVHFVDATRSISSYEMIHMAKFVMIYNSTIGLEASIMGKPVLCAGKSRFTQIPTVFFPDSASAHKQLAGKFLNEETLSIPEEHQINARRFLYKQLFYYSLPFNAFIEDDGVWNGFVRFKPFSLSELTPEKNHTIETLVNGILKCKPIELKIENPY